MQLEAASERFEGGVRRAEDEDPPWFGEARQGDCEWSSQAQEGFPQSLDECQVTQAETTLAQLRERLPELGLVLWEKSGVPMPAPRSLASGCAFLEADGCRFSVAERPCQCLAMIPNEKTLEQPQGCHCPLPDEFDRDAAKQRWQRYWQTV